MLFLLIKDYHRGYTDWHMETDNFFICEEMSMWIENTLSKHHVNLLRFAEQWIDYFCNNENIWPATHRKKSSVRWRKYDYDLPEIEVKQRSLSPYERNISNDQ